MNCNFILGFILFCVKNVMSQNCYWNSECVYKYFSSKTPYNTVRGDIRDSIVKSEGCEPVSIWALYRHGKRNPGAFYTDAIKEILNVRDHIESSYRQGKSSLCAQDVQNIVDWSIAKSFFEDNHDLSTEGILEMEGLGRRFKQAFPELLSSFEEGSYTFRPAFGHWIEKSAVAFIAGFENNNNITIDDSIVDYDVICPYDSCDSYQRYVRKNPKIYTEAFNYLNNPEYIAAKNRIRSRIGLGYNITDANIIALYDLCRYLWSAIDNKASPWCALFDKDDLEQMEYIGDLRHYYRNGYGTPVNKYFGEVIMADLLKNMQKAKEGRGKKVIGYFSHATVMDMIYTSLGLFKDHNPLTSVHRDPHRKWRTSKSSCFAANLVAVLNSKMKGTTLLVSMFLCIFGETTTALFCYWNTGCPYKYFSSKTSYTAVRGDLRDSKIEIKDCEPISIWAIYRHGKRNPGSYFGSNMKQTIAIRNDVKESYEEGKSSLCAQDVENLQNWIIDDKLFNEPSLLNEEGYQEMLGLGKRLKQTFPQLLNNLKDVKYTFRAAYGDRMQKSLESFIEGLKGSEHGAITYDTTINDYDVITPYATCGKYQQNILKNPDTYKEVTKYHNNSDYLIAKDRIQRRIGIKYNLTNDNITGLYDLCRYTWSGVDGKVSPWCALFTKEDLVSLEYIGDLQHYYRNGYGSPINEKLGHMPMTDLLKKFQEAKNGHGNTITSYITHGTLLDMIFTALGLFKDDSPLTGAHRNPNRKWRSGKTTIFSANIVAALNRCNNDGAEDYNVVFYLNEEPLRSICNGGVCSWQEFEDKLTPFLNTTIDFCEFKSELY